GQVAHNSFVHSYTELGFFGGTFFVAAFYLAIAALHRLKRRSLRISNPEIRRLRPYLFALVASYAVGMLSLSRGYVVPTYLTLGLAAAYLRLANVRPTLPLLRVSPWLVRRLLLVSAASVVGIYCYIRVFARYG